jgi:Holliday junction resolvasome RuvABC endonuclease subunit
MSKNQNKYFRVLAIAPSTNGFGFAVLEGQETLAIWGIKSAKGDKNAQSLAKALELIAHYQPDVLVLPNVMAKNERRAPRIKALCGKIARLGELRKIKVVLFSTEQVRNCFFAGDRGTKHALAIILARRFSAELGDSLPPKRRLWVSEDRRMDIFDAVALALTFRLKMTKRIA